MNHRSYIQNSNPAKLQGMTLLEVLVATGILAVISSMAFLSLDTLIQSKQSLSDTTEKLNQFNLVQFQLQTDIQMAITSNQILPSSEVPEFTADSQTFTLLRYRNATIPNQRASRTNKQPPQSILAKQNLIRVRWSVRNDQWLRSIQSAASPINSNQWQVRPMLDLQGLTCNYQNTAGQMQSIWPNSQIQNAQLPEVVNCQVQNANGDESVIKLVPWQRAGWL